MDKLSKRQLLNTGTLRSFSNANLSLEELKDLFFKLNILIEEREQDIARKEKSLKDKQKKVNQVLDKALKEGIAIDDLIEHMKSK